MKGIGLYVLCLWLAILGSKSSMAQTVTSNSPVQDVVKMDPALDQILTPDAKLEMLKGQGYFEGGEGPVWVQEGKAGYLLFSDVPGNVIFKWKPGCFSFPCPPDGTLSVYLEHSGYRDESHLGPEDYKGSHLHIGSNGLTLDRQGRLILDEYGDRAVERLEKDGSRTVLADRYEGKRLTCPNDVVAKSNGAIYFTDGGAACLRGREDSPEKELPFHGVFFVKDGKVQLLDKDPEGGPPNGLAFSPDEKILYVNNGGPGGTKKIMAYDVLPDDTLANRRVFADFIADNGLGGPDGMKVDRKGNLYSTGPGGLWILSPDGKRLGMIRAPEKIRFANLAFGDADGKTLYVVGPSGLWRLRLLVPGVRPSENK